jgi:hypothetical protein
MDVFGADDFYRVAGGDNRPLVIKGGADAVESELASRPRRAPSADSKPGAIEQLTVFEVADRIRKIRGRPGLVLLYNTRNPDARAQFADIVRVAEECRSRGIEVLAFHVPEDSSTVAGLDGFLARHAAPFPPLLIYGWRPGLLDATMAGLGIQIGQRWANPLVALLDQSGQVVWQAQGVTDWSAVQAAIEGLER